MKKLLIIVAALATGLLSGHAQTTFTNVNGDISVDTNWDSGLPLIGNQGTIDIASVRANDVDINGWDIVVTNGGSIADSVGGYQVGEITGGSIIDVQTGGSYTRSSGTMRFSGASLFKVSGGTVDMSGFVFHTAVPGGATLEVSGGSYNSGNMPNFVSSENCTVNVSGGTATFGVSSSDERNIIRPNNFYNVSGGTLILNHLAYGTGSDDTNNVTTISNDGDLVTHIFDNNDKAATKADRYINFATDNVNASWTWTGKAEADFIAMWNQGTLRHNGESGLTSAVFEDHFVVVGAVVSPAPPVSSSTFTGGAADGGLWATSGNWSDGVPNSSKTALINSNLTANLNSGPGSAQVLLVGSEAGQSGGVTNGTLTVAKKTEIGSTAGSSGVVDVTSITAGTASDDMNVGTADNATGSLDAGSGTLTGDNLSVGVGAAAVGTIDMGTGSLSFDNETIIGSGTSASGTVDAATFNLAGDIDLTIGESSDAYGRVTASSGTLALDTLTIALDRDTVGILDMGSGTATVAGQVSIGQGRDSDSTLNLASPIVLNQTNGFYVGTGVGSSTDATMSDFSVSGPIGSFGVGEGTHSTIKDFLATHDSIGQVWVNTSFAITAGTREITGLNLANQNDATASFSVGGSASATYSGKINLASGNNTSYALDLADLLSGPHTASTIDVARGDNSVATLVYTNDALLMTGHMEVGSGGDYSDGTVLLKSLEMDSSADAISIALQGSIGSTGTVTILEDATAGVIRVARGADSEGTLMVGGTLEINGLYLNAAGNLSNAVGIITADVINKTNSANGSIQVAQGAGTDGTIIAGSGALSCKTLAVGVGDNSVGLFAVTNGTVALETVQIAMGELSDATVLVGLTPRATNDVNIGTGNNAVGSLTLPSGTLAAANLNLGSANGGVGIITLTGGNLVVTGTVGGGNPTNSYINIADSASLFTWAGKEEADFEALWNAGMLRSDGESGLTGATFSDYFSVTGDTLSVVTVLPIGDLTITTDGIDVSVSWDTVNGRSYDLRYDASLTFATWTNVYTNVVGTGTEVTVDIPADEAAEFYMVTSD